MNKIILIILIFIFDNIGLSQSVNQNVDQFWGSEGGNVFIGAHLPFGMMRVGPDCEGAKNTSGYTNSKPIFGFSHTHLSGTGGGGRYGNILLTPQVGTPSLKTRAATKIKNQYAAPGYYKVTLQRQSGDVTCEMTATQHAAIHQFQFKNWNSNNEYQTSITLDLSHSNSKDILKSNVDSEVKINSNTEIEGWSSYKDGWGGEIPYKVYFYAQFQFPFDTSGIIQDSIKTFEKSGKGKKLNVFAQFKTSNNTKILVKIAISFISTAKAKANLQEISDWDFEKARNDADQIWEKDLSKIQLKGGSLEQRKMFYSALRNTLIMPTDATGENDQWQSSEPHFREHYCIWDVYRSVMPLHTILYPEKQQKIIRSLLDVYKNKGWLPDGFVAGHYADVQGGSNSDIVLTDAIIKNLGGFDTTLALEAMLKNATIQSNNPNIYGRYNLEEYNKKGFLTTKVKGATSRSLEYYYNDWCIAQIAKRAGKTKLSNQLLKRSQNYKKLFYKEKNSFWGKDSLGKWMPNFTKGFSRSDHWNDPIFYEGNAWVYATYVPHDMLGLIKLHGSDQNFETMLDSLFTGNHFEIGNEQVFMTPYAYNYINKYPKTVQRLRESLADNFTVGSSGLPGQDDSGALSSWYLWSSMGLFPIAGQSLYLIGEPLFDEIKIELPNQKALLITCNNKNKNIPQVKINGKKLNGFLTHQDLINGGILEFIYP